MGVPGSRFAGPVSRVRLRRLAFLGAAGLLAGGLAAAPRMSALAQTPVFRVGADLVVVDLVPTSDAGRFVDDLTAGDIQVFEDGKPQRVEFLRLVRPGQLVSEITASSGGSVATSPGAEAVRSVAGAGPHLVIVIDQQSLSSAALIATREAIGGMLVDLPAGTRVMLAALRRNVEIRHAFTDALDEIADALAAVQPTSGVEELKLVEFTDKVDQLCDGSQNQSIDQAIMLGKALVHETRDQLRSAADGLSALSRMLAAVPGRKHIVLYSAGYPLDPTSAVTEIIGSICGASVRAREELTAVQPFDGAVLLQDLVDEANRAQVSIYAIDARGLVTDSMPSLQRGSPRLARRGLSSQITRLDAIVPQEYIRGIAGDSGGRWFLNTNDLARGLRSAWADASEYYLIGYAPTGARRNGRFHRIEVKVSRPGLDLRYRRGYRESSGKELADRDIVSALQYPALFSDDDLDVETVAEGGKLKVTVFIAPGTLAFTNTGDVHSSDIAIHAVLRDSQGKLVGGKALFTKDVALRLRADRLAALRASDSIEVPTEVPLPRPGSYTLTVVARHSNMRLATNMKAVTVP